MRIEPIDENYISVGVINWLEAHPAVLAYGFELQRQARVAVAPVRLRLRGQADARSGAVGEGQKYGRMWAGRFPRAWCHVFPELGWR